MVPDLLRVEERKFMEFMTGPLFVALLVAEDREEREGEDTIPPGL